MGSSMKETIRFSWGSGYMELNFYTFLKLSKAKQTQIIKAVTKAAERSK